MQAPYLLKVGIYNIEGAHNKEKQVVDNVKDSYMFISGKGDWKEIQWEYLGRPGSS